jgi:hypothetical protein
MESHAKNYIDIIRICVQNVEGLHRTVQKQPAGAERCDRRSPERIL